MHAIYATALNVTTGVVLIAGAIAVILAAVIGVAYLIAWTAEAWRWRAIPVEKRAWAAANIAVTRRIIAITVPGLTVVVSPHKTFRRRFNDPKWAAVYKAAQSNDTDDAVKEEK